MEAPDTGVLIGYNARGATYRDVAAEFVPPDEYWQLVSSSDNQALTGPRGIGKTTLLRMLVGAGLEQWEGGEDSEAQQARDSVDFTGVLVPANKMWSGQVKALTGSMIEHHRSRFGVAAFSYMALNALVEAAEYRARGTKDVPYLHRRVELSASDESEIARAVAEAFSAPASTASFRSLRQAVHQNVAGMGRALRSAANPDTTSEELKVLTSSPRLDVDFYSAAAFFVTMFNEAVGEKEASWVFLLDELEFLPIHAQGEIADAVQGQDPILRFKISQAPWTTSAPTINRPLEGLPFNDFTPIELSPERRESKDRFARRLFEQEMGKYGRPEQQAEDILGKRGGFEPEPKDKEAGSYAVGGSNHAAVTGMYEIDEDFREWFIRARLDLDDLNKAKENEGQWGQLRKGAQMARLRLAYWKEGNSSAPRARSRKTWPRELYSGPHSVWAMSEANPRWIKAFAHELLSRKKATAKITDAQQVTAAERMADKYLDYFRAVDVRLPVEDPPERSITPYEMVCRLGTYFEHRHHEVPFSADAPTVATVDVEDPWQLAVLNSLVFLGGVVRLKRNRAGEERIRLAHMFSPRFKLPLRNGGVVRLSRALAGEEDEQAEPMVDEEEAFEAEQLTLDADGGRA